MGDAVRRRALRVDVARVGILGLNAWIVTCVLPLALAGPRAAGALAVLLIPLIPLALGAAVLPRSRRVATVMLLAAFPPALAMVVALLPRLVLSEPFSPLGLVVGALSVVGYGVGTALATSRPDRVRTASQRPLGSEAAPRDGRRRRGQQLLLGVSGAAALLTAVLAPTLGSRDALLAAWGDAADEAELLCTVVAGALATATMALFVGPALRATRERPRTAAQIRTRVGALMLVVLSGMTVWYLMHRG